jgi:hypothetical protein
MRVPGGFLAGSWRVPGRGFTGKLEEVVYIHGCITGENNLKAICNPHLFPKQIENFHCNGL